MAKWEIYKKSCTEHPAEGLLEQFAAEQAMALLQNWQEI